MIRTSVRLTPRARVPERERFKTIADHSDRASGRWGCFYSAPRFPSIWLCESASPGLLKQVFRSGDRAFKVDQSSLVRGLERMNSVHRCHDPETFKALTHYIFTFHDSTFECVAASFTFTVEDVGPDEEYGSHT
jgi:hypothetical protein